jgi:hypothetical protein
MDGYNKFSHVQHYFYRDWEIKHGFYKHKVRYKPERKQAQLSKDPVVTSLPLCEIKQMHHTFVRAASLMNYTPQKNRLQMPADWIMACLSDWLNLLAGRETAERVLQKCGVQLSST